MKQYSLRFKVSAAFLLISLFLFLMILIFLNLVLRNQFQSYTVNRLDKTMAGTVALVNQSIDNARGTWNLVDIGNIGMNALGEGLILRVSDKTGTVIWDAKKHNNGMCIQLLQKMAHNMQTYDANFKGGYEERSFPVKYNGAVGGTVSIGYYGPYFMNDADIQFVHSLNSFLKWAALVSFLLCILFGSNVARNLTKPIHRAIEVTGRIAKGDLGSRIRERSNTKEMIQLTASVNSLAQSLEDQELLRKRLTADVAHELRTPLATLQSHMEAMIDGVWEPDKKVLTSCNEEILRITKIVGELETLSQYDAESLKLQQERCDLNGLVRQIVSNFELELKRKAISVSVEGQEKWITCDKDKLSQVFINILSNALKFTPQDGAISVRIGGDEETAVIEIKDSGIGIPEKDLPFIFERFYRSDMSRSRKTGGSGIGLAIANSIVKAHRGEIVVQSEEGKGSVFAVLIPVGDDAQSLT